MDAPPLLACEGHPPGSQGPTQIVSTPVPGHSMDLESSTRQRLTCYLASTQVARTFPTVIQDFAIGFTVL